MALKSLMLRKKIEDKRKSWRPQEHPAISKPAKLRSRRPSKRQTPMRKRPLLMKKSTSSKRKRKKLRKRSKGLRRKSRILKRNWPELKKARKRQERTVKSR